ncbi:MAG: formylglycine-generating enzyme family protein, partial [Acidobacteriota bacterium]
LLRAIALNGHGKVSPDLLLEPWTGRPNRSEKYLYLPSAAAWAAAQVGQADDDTIGILIAGLGRTDRPRWVEGDFIGALTALTGRRFGYDKAAWQAWWERRRAGLVEEMVQIPAGTLLMGSDDGGPAERPVHSVFLPAFSIDRFETTNGEFAAFAATTGHITNAEASGAGWDWDGRWAKVKGADWRHPHGLSSSIQGLENHPVVQVSWIDAQAYCRWRGKRLPTEAEWERAARGDGGRTYPWSNRPPHDGKRYRASYGSDRCCRADAGDDYLFTAPVGSFPLGRSPFGLEDMAGNVWEWVEDWFDQEFYRRSPSENPVNDTPGKRRVIRGGGWGNNPSGLRSTLRHANPPDIGLSMVGFRCAR